MTQVQNDDDGFFTLILNNTKAKGNTLVEVNRVIPKQKLKLVGYSVTSTNQNLIKVLNVKIGDVNSVSHLIDNTERNAYFPLPCTDSATQTFVSGCNYTFNMNKDLPKKFYVQCLDSQYGDITAGDLFVVLTFNIDYSN